MSVQELLKPRFIIGLVALLATVVMMYLQVVRADIGITIILGILVAFGAYHARAPQDRR